VPIYEYSCLKCGSKSEELIKTFMIHPAESFCKLCGGEMVKLMSNFAYHRSDGDRLLALNTKQPYCRDYFQDDRNIGGFAKKRLIDLGVPDAVQQMDKIVTEARKSVKEAF